MPQELIYTSAPKGLRLGSRGFCTVASTAGMAKPLADRLEALSGYKHLYPPGSDNAALNPVNYSYVTFKLGGKTYYVLSRIADAGLDYSQRTNKLAHHVVLEASELPSAGPAWVMSQPGFFVTQWEGEPRIIEARRKLPQGDLSRGVCRAWNAAAGDAGWAGALGEVVCNRDGENASVIFSPGSDNLRLVVEAQAILPASSRWVATFSTFHAGLPPSVECRWRFILDETPDAIKLRRSPGVVVVDLQRKTPCNFKGELVEAARTGRIEQSKAPERNSLAPQTNAVPLATPVLAASSPELEQSPIMLSAQKAPVAGPPKLPARRLTKEDFDRVAKSSGGSRVLLGAYIGIGALLVAVVVGAAFYLARTAGSRDAVAATERSTPLAPGDDVADAPPQSDIEGEDDISANTPGEDEKAALQPPATFPGNEPPAEDEPGSSGDSSTPATPPEAPPENSASSKVAVPPDYLAGVKSEVELFPPGGSSPTAYLLASLMPPLQELDIKLIGLPNDSSIKISPEDTDPADQRWRLTADNTELASLAFSQAGGKDEHELQFKWAQQSLSAKYTDLITRCGLVISVREQGLSERCIFRTKPKNPPKEPLTKQNLVNLLNEINKAIEEFVPPHQPLEVKVRLVAPGSLEPSSDVLHDESNPSATFNFGPGGNWEVVASLLSKQNDSARIKIETRVSENDDLQSFNSSGFDKAVSKHIKAQEKSLHRSIDSLVSRTLREDGNSNSDVSALWKQVAGRVDGVIESIPQEPTDRKARLRSAYESIDAAITTLDEWNRCNNELDEKFRLHVQVFRILKSTRGDVSEPVPVIEFGNADSP